jgi:hypothetical protein
MIQKFKKKPVEIEAIQWSGNSNKKEIEQFVGKELKSELESETAYVAGKGAPIFSLLIETKEGVMKAFQGDWIIKEPFPTGDRDFYPCKNDIFIKTYDAPEKPMIQKFEIEKPLVFCGVTNMDGAPAKMTDEEIERVRKMCEGDGKYNAVFCKDNLVLLEALEVEIEKPIGEWILKQNISGTQTDNGLYFHYSEVCSLLKLMKKEYGK